MKNILVSDELLKDLCMEGVDISKAEEVVTHAEESNDKTFDGTTYFAHKKIGKITLWVSYEIKGDDILIKSVYSHRLDLKEE